ncbi:serine/threonine protein kinase, partial [Streptomyces sp. SID6137]|nr:serine/threonine protein kinase [Streptomyces sp. SID6137]
AAEKLRGALRSVRKAAAGAAAGTAADAARPKNGGSASASGSASGKGPGAATAPNPAGSPTANPAGNKAGNAGSAKPRSGWPVMPPPDLDLPPRPVPKASLTDVVPRRTLVVVAVVVALAVIGTVLAVALSGGDDKDDKGAARTTAGASASAGAGRSKGPAAGTRTDGGSSAPTAAGTGTGTGTGKDVSASASADAGSAPAVSTRKGGQGYSIGLPKGWSYQSHGSAGDRYTGPDGQKLLVAWTGTPKDDPVADWKSQEHYMVRSQYHRIRIEKADYRSWNTADWEFTYADGGTEYRTVDRGFVVNDHLGYALMYTAKAGDWDGDLRKDTWKTLTASFKPKS